MPAAPAASPSGRVQPPPLTFRLSRTEPEPGLLELSVGGELDLAVAGQLRDAIAAAAGKGQRVLIDLEGCEFIDSTGIATVMRGMQTLRDLRLGLAVYGPSKQVKRVLDLVGLADCGVIFASREQALATLRDG
jgi:anti-anti-sigma factor